jgi:hypothetical protein
LKQRRPHLGSAGYGATCGYSVRFRTNRGGPAESLTRPLLQQLYICITTNRRRWNPRCQTVPVPIHRRHRSSRQCHQRGQTLPFRSLLWLKFRQVAPPPLLLGCLPCRVTGIPGHLLLSLKQCFSLCFFGLIAGCLFGRHALGVRCCLRCKLGLLRSVARLA